MSWDASGIVYSDGRSGIFRVSANGGMPEQLMRVEDGYAAWGPQLLPGGSALLFTLVKAPRGTPFGLWQNPLVVVQSLTSGQRKTVIEDGGDATYLASGHLVFAVSGSLFAMAFDPSTQATSGDRVPVLAGVRRSRGVGDADFAVSSTGALVYLPGPVDASARRLSLIISEPSGTTRKLKLEPRGYSHPRVSPDGTRLAVTTEDDNDAVISIYELSETRALRRLTVEGQNRFPVWSSDGERVAFQSDRGGDRGIFWQRADARSEAERLTTAGEDTAHIPTSFSPDGSYLLFDEFTTGGYALHVLSLRDKKGVPFGNVKSNEPTGAVFSPDGRWVAYATGIAGSLYDRNRGVFIQPFPSSGVPVPAPKARIDYHPVWSRAGKLFYVASAVRPLVSVEVKTAPSISFGAPQELLSTLPRPSVFSNGARGYDILPDGRILVVSPEDQAAVDGGRETAIHVVLNWFEELKRLVPTR
jgi:Tol biopolymer transport system component